MPEEKKESKTVESQYLETCEVPIEDFKAGPFIMVIFGGAGDLSMRKLIPTLYSLYIEKLIDNFSIIGFGLPSHSNDEYRSFVDESLKTFARDIYNESDCMEFCRHFYYQAADLSKEAPY